MICGSDCWDAEFQHDMVIKAFDGKKVQTFADLPGSLYDSLARSAARYPSHVCIVDDNHTSYTYAQVQRMVEVFAAYLVNQHVSYQDRVALLLPASIEFVVALYALSYIGAIATVLPTKYRAPELKQLLNVSEPQHMILDEVYRTLGVHLHASLKTIIWTQTHGAKYGFEEQKATFCPEAHIDPCASALMLFTSGTTAGAKGVVLKNYHICHAATVYNRLMRTTSYDRCLICTPIYHVTGLIALLAHFIVTGATVYLHKTFDATRALSWIQQENITYIHGTPTSLHAFLSVRHMFPSLPSLRVILSGSSRESLTSMQQFHEWLPQVDFRVVYGMTETASPALLFPCDTPTSAYPMATGKPVLGLEVKIIDEHGEECPVGIDGELYIRGTCVTQEYFHSEIPVCDDDGWLSTGDIAYYDQDHMICVHDRKKDMINCGGEKVWCSSVEEALLQIPAICASCVTGIPDAYYGEIPVAAVVLQPDSSISPSDISAILKGTIASFQIPRHIVVMKSLPQTHADKPDRKAVRTLILETLSQSLRD